MTYVLAQLASLGALVAAFGIGGVALERVLPGASLPPELRVLARCVLGVVLWMLALFALACLGGLGPAGIAGVAIACALAFAVTRRRGGAAPIPRPAWGLRFLAAAALASLPLWLLALSWSVSWDAGAYHLTLPRLYLAAGGFVPVPGSVYSNWPLSTELLYAAALAIGEHPVAKLLHGVFGLATLWAVWLGARGVRREAAGWIAAALVLASPLVLFEWSVAYVDLAYAFFFCAGLVFVARWRSGEDDAHAALWLAGLCGGALTGVKLSGVLGAVALFAAVLGPLLARAARGEARGALSDALRFATPVLLLWLPWLVKSAAYTGNPVYPLLFDLFGGPDWSGRLSAQFLAWQRSIGMGRGISDTLLLPLRVTLEGGPDYAHFGGVIGAYWLLALPLAWPGRKLPLVRVAMLASGAYFALWALGSQQARFLIPILPALALGGAIGASEGLARLGDVRLRRAGTALLALGAAGLALHALSAPAARARELLPRLAAGREALRAAALRPIHHFVATLPADAKLLLMNTNQGFFLARDYRADSFFEASQIADGLRGVETAEQARDRLVAQGFTHVLRARIDWGIDWPPGLVALLRDRELAPRRFRSPDGSVEVFELARPAAKDPDR
jgi:hypothetical protein